MTYDAAVAADSPVVWLKLADTSGSGTCADSSGNGWTGTPSNVTLGVTGPFTASPSETAGSFTGTGSDVTTTYNPASIFGNEGFPAFVFTPRLLPLKMMAYSHGQRIGSIQ